MFYAGGAAVVGQTILVRELMVSFYGTEFALAAALTCWLAFVPMGALIAGAVLRFVRAELGVFCGAAAALGLALPAQFLLARLVRPLLGAEAGQFLSLPAMVLCAALAAGPVSFLVGFLFPVACRLEERAIGAASRGITRVYVAEALGSGAAGAVMSFVLLALQPPGAIAGLVGVLWLVVGGLWVAGVRGRMGFALAVPGALWLGFSPGGVSGARAFAAVLCVAACGGFALLARARPSARSRCGAGAALFALAFLTGLGFLLGGEEVRRWTLRERWGTFSRFDLLESLETRYQHVDLGERHGQRVVVQNGVRGELFPEPWETPRAAALLLTQHPRPRSILVIGGGLGGLCQRLLEAGPFSVDHVEMDPALLSLYGRWLEPELLAPLGSDRFAAFACDGRHFVQRLRAGPDGVRQYAVPFGDASRERAAPPYDIVLVNLGNPTSASASRFYTAEFFAELRRILAPGGVVALWGIAGSETYLRGPVLRYTACIYRTLRAGFPRVVVRPGSELCFFAGEAGGPTADASVLAQRFDALGLEPAGMRYMFELSEFLPERVRYTRAELEGAAHAAMVNTDDRPVAYTLFLAIQEHYGARGRHAGGAAPSARRRGFFDSLLGVRPGWFIAPFVLCLVVVGMVRASLGARRAAPWSWGFAIVTTGMFGLASEVLIIYAYQTRFGYVYRDVSIIVGLFMLGLAAGAAVSARLRAHAPGRMLIALEGMQASLLLALPGLLGVLSKSPLLFVLVSALAGFVAGAEFPLACRLALGLGHRTATVSGVYDAADHAGGLLGAAATGLVLMPAFGLGASAVLLACAKAASLLAVAFASGGAGGRGSAAQGACAG